ncbi:MAG: hypothetical protein R6W99_06600, partial [Clostridia bacterium]
KNISIMTVVGNKKKRILKGRIVDYLPKISPVTFYTICAIKSKNCHARPGPVSKTPEVIVPEVIVPI